MTNKKSKLSNWLPTAIRQAVADMCETMRNPKYKIDMSNWWVPKACTVCLAGCVMAARFEEIDFWITSFAGERRPDCHEQEHMFKALDAARDGDIDSAMIFAHSTVSQAGNYHLGVVEYYKALYDNDKKHIPFSAMLEMANDIEHILLENGYKPPEDDEPIYVTAEMVAELESIARY